ncbi:SigB/SigF/SigG family RNA polymerase sigma factor, partial [Streptomyces durbertensis]
MSTIDARPAARSRRPRHDHHDAPDTTAALQRLTTLPDGPERDALRQEVVSAWLPMAGRLARKYRNRGEETEDLEQVAALGLTKAVERFDPSLGKAFESYAVPMILGEIKKHFRDNTWDVHVPRRVQELRNRVRRSVRELAATTGRAPTIAQLAEHTGLSQEDAQLGLDALESYSSLSLDAELPGAESGYSLLDTLGSAEPAYQRIISRESVKPCLRRLPEREKRILYLRFYCDMTQSRIADRLNISQMHVSRVLRRTCERVRRSTRE